MYSPSRRDFLKLIDQAGVDIVHGHSSHHVKGIEVYRDRPIIYGCGDFLTDYEGIEGHESYRDDLGLMYFVTMDPAGGRLVRLEMTPTRLKRFQVNRAPDREAQWLQDVLTREGRPFGTRATRGRNNELTLQWGDAAQRGQALSSASPCPDGHQAGWHRAREAQHG